MKISAFALLTYLTLNPDLVSSKIQGPRGVRDLGGEPVPPPTPQPSCKRKSSGSKSGGTSNDKCGCSGGIFYVPKDFGVLTTWIDAYQATPQGCVLTPVASEEEYLEVRGLISNLSNTTKNNCWVGVYSTNPNGSTNRDDWLNPDTSGIVPEEAWRGVGQPTMDGSRASFDVNDEGPSGLITRNNSGNRQRCAVYKCCLYECFA